jgi:hypothetical protein
MPQQGPAEVSCSEWEPEVKIILRKLASQFLLAYLDSKGRSPVQNGSLEAQISLVVPLLSESLTQFLYVQNRKTSPMVLLDKIILAPCSLLAQIYMTCNFVRQRHVPY